MGHDMFYMEQEVKEQIIKLDTKCKEHKKEETYLRISLIDMFMTILQAMDYGMIMLRLLQSYSAGRPLYVCQRQKNDHGWFP